MQFNVIYSINFGVHIRGHRNITKFCVYHFESFQYIFNKKRNG